MYLNPLVIAVADIGGRPAGVRQHVVVRQVEQDVEDGHHGQDEVEGRGGLAPGKVGEGPGRVPREAQVRDVWVDLADDRLHATLYESAPKRIQRNYMGDFSSVFPAPDNRRVAGANTFYGN